MEKPTLLSDYLYRYSNDECSPDFHYWACLTLVGALLGQRVWICHGRFKAIPVLYTVLVGTAGSGKSSAKDVVQELMIDIFPDYTRSDSMQSPQDLIAQMSLPECCRAWKDKKTGKIEEYHPFFLIINELSSFLSTDHKKMVLTLIDGFDAKVLSAGFKKDRAEGIKGQVRNPHLPMIACVVPEWFMDNMSMDLFKTGLGRRMCIIYRDKYQLNHDPKVPDDSGPSWTNVIKHLQKLHTEDVQGEVKLNADATEWFKNYYYDKERRTKSEDPIISTFQETEHMVLLRVALLLSFAEYDFNYTITPQHLAKAMQLLLSLRPDIQRLTGGIGQNVMAGVMEQMMDYLQLKGGMVRQVILLKNFYRACPRGKMDFEEGIKTLVEMNRMVVAEIPGSMSGSVVRWVFTPEGWSKYQSIKKPLES